MGVLNDSYATDTLRERWHVARVRDDLWTICTEHGVSVAVQPRYADKGAWAQVAESIVAQHNAELEARWAKRRA